MSISSSPTREKYPLSHKKIIKKSLGSWIGLFTLATFVALIVGAGTESAMSSLITFLILFGPLAGLVYLYQLWYFNVYYYDLNADFIVIRKNPITPKEINIPYERVQDIYMDQDIMDRIFGIYDVHLSSATISSGMEAHIDGLEKTAADGLKNELLSIVNKKIRKTPNVTNN